MRFARKIRLCTVLATLGAVLTLAAPPASAATAVVADESDGAIGVDIPKAIFGISLTGSGSLSAVRATFNQVGDDNDFELTHLRASPDGVAVYRDSSRAGANDDVLDPGDTRVSSGFTSSGLDVEIQFQTPLAPPPQEGKYNLFIVVQTSNIVEDGLDFSLTLPSGVNNAFNTGLLGATLFGGITSAPITVDGQAPTVQLTSTPSTPEGNVVWTFSENVVGVSGSNVVLRLNGSSTNIAASVTYDAGTRTATINPNASLSPGATYRTIVNPGSATDLVTDEAGNPVEFTQQEFSLMGAGSTPGVIRGNTWLLNNWFDPTHDVTVAFGRSTDFPVVGDWDGDGDFTPGVVRGNVWYLNNDFDGAADVVFAFGRSTDFPVVGDWDGDGDFTPGVVRGNVWYLNNDTDGLAETHFPFGKWMDFPVVGDWDDDGHYSVGVVRGNVWMLNNGTDGSADLTFAFGRPDDFPIAADWNGPTDSGATEAPTPQLPVTGAKRSS